MPTIVCAGKLHAVLCVSFVNSQSTRPITPGIFGSSLIHHACNVRQKQCVAVLAREEKALNTIHDSLLTHGSCKQIVDLFYTRHMPLGTPVDKGCVVFQFKLESVVDCSQILVVIIFCQRSGRTVTPFIVLPRPLGFGSSLSPSETRTTITR